MLKMAQELLGLREFLREMGVKKELVVKGDSSAAKGIMCRRGSGKVKHLEVRQLWLQERVARKEVKLEKIPRSQNTGDALTHHWSKAENWNHIQHMMAVKTLEDDSVAGAFSNL